MIIFRHADKANEMIMQCRLDLGRKPYAPQHHANSSQRQLHAGRFVTQRFWTAIKMTN